MLYTRDFLFITTARNLGHPPVHIHISKYKNICTPRIPGPLVTGTTDQLTVKILQSKGVYILKAQPFPVCDVHRSSHMELKGMFTLMERKDEANPENC